MFLNNEENQMKLNFSHMNYINKISFIIVFLFLASQLSFAGGKDKDKGYQIKVKITGIKDTVCYLGYYYADKQYILDTNKVDANGYCVFEGKEPLEGGIYFIYSPEKTLVQILIGEQRFSVETDTKDLVGNMKVTGSIENKLFTDFHIFRMNNYNKVQALKARLDKNKSNKDSTDFLNSEIDKIDKAVLAFMNEAESKYPNTLYSSIMKSNVQIDIPDSPKDEKGNEIDSLFALHYMQKHYFDNINFGDGRLVRTPILHQKIMDYLKRLVVPHPDSIIRACDFIIEKSKADSNVFRYALPTLTNYYETSKYMGMDAVFVHLAEKYYLSGQAWWADSTLTVKMQERVDDLKPTLLGGQAHNIIMYDTLLRPVPLHAIKADYTSIFFYEPDCGHCKKATPKMKKLAEAYKSKGFKVYGINIKTDIEEWKTFIKEYKIQEFINVSDPYYRSKFRDYFDIYSTPVIYLLDKDKNILAKRLSPEQLEEMLRSKMGIKGDEGRILEKPEDVKEEEEESH
ncbi:MAG TPA: hypothetical protein DDX39_05645 [Bacteroidales bacterium]|nr:MAG: hypothetical protein A2W98_06915 [Bacteroidetes bacterium GWF2_33_38]OFY76173.1 MAG: hypothetical protein A2265_09585 [Bacteroidetes bacterium RIFOXYA12_FULL_33_9]OFY90544.1 MAG: hypothetical protein A2236_05665 [Bacteroidetes bacterium RIFOXYA2_FULL_33_7]HBF88107.1 hypothetical protein [Bacteroidales bacterium]